MEETPKYQKIAPAPPLVGDGAGGAQLVGDSAALFADVRGKLSARAATPAPPSFHRAADWFRLEEVLDHAEAALAENASLRAKLAQEGEQEREKFELLKEAKGIRKGHERTKLLIQEAFDLGEKAFRLTEADTPLETATHDVWQKIMSIRRSHANTYPTVSRTLPAAPTTQTPTALPETCQCALVMVMRGKGGAGYCANCKLLVPEAGIEEPEAEEGTALPVGGEGEVAS